MLRQSPDAAKSAASRKGETAHALREGEALLAWYDVHARRMPWRAARGAVADPYAVWLSEIMLQQTNVTTVKPYFEKFLALWPDVASLAAAPVEAVMQAWAGLGYYSRARNLHACAIAVAEHHGGSFPPAEAALLQLPGIGPYTAAAIASIAFGQRAIVVDGNVERVMTRLRAIADPMPGAKARVRAAVAEIAPASRPGDFAQAMMDLGATICTPRNPACVLCPLQPGCAARASGQMERYPVKPEKPLRPQRVGASCLVIRDDGFVLVRTRPPKGLLGGMTELPGAEWRRIDGAAMQPQDEPPDAELSKALGNSVDWRRLPGSVEHVFTHFSLRLIIYAAKIRAYAPTPPGCRYVAITDLDKEALPSLMRKVVALGRREGVL